MVNFSPLGPDRTLVSLRLSYDPEGAVEKVGDALGLVTARILGDLNRFKDFIEKRQVPTGAWRGEIEGREVRPTGEQRSH